MAYAASMTAHDMCTDIATLLNPIPVPADDTDDDWGPPDQVFQEREDAAESLRLAWSEGEYDPLLSTLENLRGQRLRLEAEMRMLIAYGRCFTHPRPYKLIDLANAAGMSISGVRTAYEAEEIGQVADILGRPPAGQKPVTRDD